MSPPAGSAPPTRTRHWLIVFAVALAVIQYVDRVCISQAAPRISSDLNLTKEQMGWVLGVFALAYSLFEIPTGYWGDRRGPRRVLLRVVLWWSLFTAATGWARSWAAMVTTRFFFGAGEAGCFPNLTKALERWLPSRERIRAQGVMWMCARWGGASTPYLVFLVLGWVNWRTAFLLFGLLGVAWTLAFAAWFRDNPREHPAINAAEAALLPAPLEAGRKFVVPWRLLFRSRSVWLLCAQYFACSYGWYFFITWFPTYLRDALKFNAQHSALLAGLPLLVGGTGSMLAGLLAPRLQRLLGDAGLVRRLFGVVGLAAAAGCLVAATFLREPLLAVGAIALASLGNDITLPGAWTACMDIGGPYVGTLSGMMNMLGNFGGFVSPIVLGYVVQRTGNWNLTFDLTASLYVLGAVCWWFLDPVTPLELQVRD